MADIFTKRKRSQIMASISGKETKPEISVRKFLFKHGFRYRKNVSSLPGKPDIVLPKHHTVILIHGCFWHGHNCKKAILPTSNVTFWREKIYNNRERDKRKKAQLKKLGWRVITIWECKVKSKSLLERSMIKLLKEFNSIQK